MGRLKQTHFNPTWQDPTLFPDLAIWISPVDTGSTDDSTYFRCKICRSGKIKLCNMGIAGVRRHAEDQREGKLSKHNMIMKSMKSQKSL